MRLVALSLISLAALMAPQAASADMLHFTFTASGNPRAGSFSFDLPSNPTPGYVDSRGAYVDTLPIEINAGGVNLWSVTHWYQGGFSFDSGDFVLSGATPFLGLLSAPSFQVGSFQMSEFDPGGRDAGVLVISNATTPEPAGMCLLATGLAAFSVVRLRRRA